MKKIKLNICWIKSLEDLFEVISYKNLLVQNIPEGQKVIISKQDKNVTINSIIGFNLSEKLKKLTAEISSFKDDFTVIGLFDHNRKILFGLDIVELNGKSLSKTPLEKRLDYLYQFNDTGFFKVVKAKTFQGAVKIIDFEKNQSGALIRERKSMINKGHKSPLFYYPKKSEMRHVIITDFYFGNHVGQSREVIFKCAQFKNGKLVLVGKTRVNDLAITKKLMKLIKRNKRAVAKVEASFSPRNKQKYTKLFFDSLVFDERFDEVVVDDERYFSPLIIVDVRAQTRSIIMTQSVRKNLNMVSGVI